MTKLTKQQIETLIKENNEKMVNIIKNLYNHTYLYNRDIDESYNQEDIYLLNFYNEQNKSLKQDLEDLE